MLLPVIRRSPLPVRGKERKKEIPKLPDGDRAAGETASFPAENPDLPGRFLPLSFRNRKGGGSCKVFAKYSLFPVFMSFRIWYTEKQKEGVVS